MSTPDSAPGSADPPPPFELTGLIITIGRKKDCDLVLPDTGCSKTHCRIVMDAGGYRVEDLESQNGTFVNDERITARTLQDGDRLRLGYSVFTFSRSADGGREKAALTFLKKVKPSLPSGEGGEASAEDDAPRVRDPDPPPAEDAGPPWVDARSGTSLSSLAEEFASHDPVTEEAPADEPPAEPAPAPPQAAPPTPDPVPAAPAQGAPRGARGPDAFRILMAAGLLALLLVTLFQGELRSGLGLGGAMPPQAPETAADPAPRDPAPPVPPAAVEGREVLEAIRAELKALTRAVRSLEADRGDPADLAASKAALEERLASLERSQRTTLAALAALREDLTRAAREAAAVEEAPAAPPAEAELPPGERLVREVMDALEKKE